MRLVCFGDIHLAFRAIEQLGPTLREADWAILGGDLTHFGDPPDAFRVVDGAFPLPQRPRRHRQPRLRLRDELSRTPRKNPA